MTTIKVDYENNAETWWQEARDRIKTCPTGLEALIDDLGADEVTVSEEEAARCLAWCEAIPGWNDGPQHAPTALIFNPAD